MKTNIYRQTAQLNIAHRRHRRWQKIVTILAAIVVFCTTYALILPAITWERQLICPLPEHTHTDDCYETTVVPAGTRLVCGMPEHTHSDECYVETKTLICVLEETAGHTHGDECFDEDGELICALAETGAHTHTDDCYEITRELICTEEEHLHSDACREAYEEHEETVLVCGYEEHTHTTACFDAPPAEDDGMFCGMVEHTHNDYCYFADGSLRCTLPEHRHTAACGIDTEADIETARKWEHSFNDVRPTGDRGADLAAIAETQIGYTASEANYLLDENGEISGRYNRYGVWYGEPYAAWNTHFVGFCMQYADAGMDVVPFEPDPELWIDALRENEFFIDTDAPEALPVGSILFYRPADLNDDITTEENEDGEEMAILFDEAEEADEVEEAEEAVSPIRAAIVTDASFDEESGALVTVTVIEGDVDGCVEKLILRAEEIEPIGYAVLPVKESETEAGDEDDKAALAVSSDPADALIELVSKPASDGAVAVITGAVPAGADAVIEAVTLTGEDLIALFGEKKAATMKSFVAYDIKIVLNGEEWQPDDTVNVTVRQPAIEVNGTETLNVAHVHDEDETVEELEASLFGEDGEIVFDTDGFSLYVFYTVDFHYEGKVFSINGYDSIYLSELFEVLGVEQSAADVWKVTFSDPSLVSVKKTVGDWLLTSLAPFSTTETLTMDFGDEGIFTLSVTDAAEYWKEVTSSADLVAGKTYMITNINNSYRYALTYGADAYRKSVSFTETTADGYYTASVSNDMRFTLTSNSGLKNVSNTTYYLNLGSSNFFNTTDRKMDFTRSGDYWTVKRNGSESYLSYANKTFALATAAGDSTNMRIYMLTDTLPTAKTEYWQEVSTIDDADADYLIVRNGYAFKYKSDNTYNCGKVTFAPVSGASNVFTTSDVTDEMRMNFASAIGTSGTTKISNGGSHVVYLGKNDVAFSDTGNNMIVSYADGVWTIKRDGSSYMLSSPSAGTFTRENTTTNVGMTIYKSIDELPAPTVTEQWMLVDKIDDTTGEYLIVRDDYALVDVNDNNVYSIDGVRLNLTPVSGKNGYFTTTTTVTDAMRMKFSTAVGTSGKSELYTSAAGAHCLYINDSGLFKNANHRQIGFTYSNGSWAIDNGQTGSSIRYLTEEGGVFSRTTNGASQPNTAKMQIYKKVTVSEEDDPGTDDPADTAEYYHRVDTLTSGKDYLIVSAQGSYALKYDGSSYSSVPVVLQPVKGNPEVYKVEDVTDSLYWRFPGADGSSSVSSRMRWKTSGSYLRLDSASIKVDATDSALSLSYNDANGTWMIKNGNYYLINNAGSYESSNSTSTKEQRNFIILEKTTEPTIPADPIGGGGGADGTTPTAPTYDPYKTVSGGKSNVTTKQGYVPGVAYSDPATSQIESRFTSLVDKASPTASQIAEVKANDGLVLSDKSVIYKKDDYGAFSNYPDNTFGVTLSLLGQEFAISETDRVPTPVDVVFIIDASGSMSKAAESGNDEVSRRDAVVNAVNGAIGEIMDQHEENRVGVVVYSSGSWDILDLDHYAPNGDGEYLTLSSGNIYSAVGVKDSSNHTVTQKTDSLQQSGTYTQSGIARAAAMFDRVTDTDYEVTLGKAESLRTYKTERQPVFILLSDGDPTISTSNYTDVLAGPHYGNGVYNSADNNQGVHGYYTILSANYYKSMTGIHYDKPAKFYTVGMGIYDGKDDATRYKDLSNSSVTSDHYKRAVLNPTSGNISDLNSTNSDVKNRSTTSKQLLDLLNNSFTDKYITVRSEASKATCAQLGLPTQSKVPVIPNPYKTSGYSYADNAYFGELGDDELGSIFNDVLEGSLKYKNYGFILRKRSSAEITDPIGEGMKLVSDPVLNYGGKNYTHTSKSTSGNVTTYTYNYKYTPTDGNAFRANLSEITVTVTTDPDTGAQTVHMIVPDDVLPAYSPCESTDVEWYYEALPARLIYQVGLNDEAKVAIAGLEAGESLTYYTNRFDKDDFTEGACATIKPTTDNPYYKPTGAYHPQEHEKTQNPTGTADYYADTMDGTIRYDGEDTMQVTQYLGNNGKLVFTSDGTNKEILPDKKPDIFKWIDAFRDGDNNPDTTLDDNASDLTDLYRLYLNLGPESAYEAIDVAFVIDCSSSMRSSRSGTDATDILGHTNVTRKAALNSLLNGLDTKAAAGTDNTSTLYPNGLMSQLQKINERNKIAVAWYSGLGGIFNTWGSGGVVPNTFEDLSGTNYVAGLHYAKELFNSDSVKNDGRKKYMVFLSDGTPTEYSPSIDDASTHTIYTSTDSTELDKHTKDAIDAFKEQFPDVTIFTVGIGNFKYDYLDRLSSSGSTIASTDFQQIMEDLDVVVTHGVGHFRKLKITDILSADLDYADPVDIVVKQVPNESTDGSGTILYQNGTILDTELLKEVKFEKDKRTITVTFMPDYEEQGGYRYSLSYNVKVKQKLYDDYAENVADGKDGYDGTVGDHSTDYIYNGNVTSSDKPGFRSNQMAWIDYERVAVDGTVTIESEIYDHPVVQVDTDRIIVSKQWADGFVNHSKDSITVKLQMKYDGTKYIDIGKTAVLSEKNAWHYTFDGLPKGYDYRVIETVGKEGFTPSYDFDTAEQVMTITNNYSTADITLRKADAAGNAITDNPASFAIYSDAACTHLIEEFSTDDDGNYTLAGLESGKTYYLRETAAPKGYRILTEVKSFTINADGSLSTPDGDSYITASGDVVTVKNKTGYVLPRTGGIGLYLFYALGLLCIAAGLIMGCRLMRRGRERRGDE